MPKFRWKNPMVVEAEQYLEGGVLPKGSCTIYNFGNNPHIHTPEGVFLIRNGDWVITGIAGERFVCCQEIFAQTYEEVHPDSDKWEYQAYPVDYAIGMALHPFMGDPAIGSELCEGCGEHYSWHQTEP